MEYLARNADQVLSRSMIIEQVWDQSFDSFTNVVDVYIRYLRNKIDQGFEPKLIHTVRGVGYISQCGGCPMNPRSLHFRLSLYHVSLLTLTLLVFAGTSYWGFRRHLIASLEGQCASQTRQIAVSLLPGLPKSGIQYLRDEMEEHYAPESNNLFFRIVNAKNEIIYESGSPETRTLFLNQHNSMRT